MELNTRHKQTGALVFQSPRRQFDIIVSIQPNTRLCEIERIITAQFRYFKNSA